MLAHRADLGGCRPLKDITAVQAHPGALDIGDKQLSLFQQIRQPAEAVAMGPLDLCDLVEGSRHSGKALLLGHVAEGLVYRVVLLILVVLRLAEQLLHIVRQVHGIGAVDGHGLARQLFHVVVKNLRVLLLLVRSEAEHRLHHMQLLLAADGGGKGVAVPGLAFARKGPHEVFQGLAVLQIHRHTDSSCFR